MKIALIVVLLLSGCAQGFSGICAFRGLGQNEQGISFMTVNCQPNENK